MLRIVKILLFIWCGLGEALNAGLAFGQSVIGDVGVHYSGKELAQEITNANVINGTAELGNAGNGGVASSKLLNSVLGEGGVGKVVMHAGLGAVHGAVLGGDSGAIVGAIGGAVGEIVPNILDQHMSGGVGSNSPPLSGGQQALRQSKIQAITTLTAAGTTFALGGDSNQINLSNSTANSVIQNNSLLHPKPTWEQEAQLQENLKNAGEIATEYIKENPEIAEAALIIGATFLPEITVPAVGVYRGVGAIALTKSVVKQETKQVVKGTTKEVIKSNGKNTAKKIHKNSHQYKGETHVYKIRDIQQNKTHKIGESAAGVRKDGKSIRAENQKRKLEKTTGQKFRTKIIRNFDSKKDAHQYENELIKRYRKVFKDQDKILPGNKGNH